MIMINGSELESALHRAHHKNYNRSFADLSKIDARMWLVLDDLMADCSQSQRKKIMRNIKNDWRNALIPVEFLMFHEHRQMQPCEKHVRVAIGGLGTGTICDLTLEDWQHFERVWTYRKSLYEIFGQE